MSDKDLARRTEIILFFDGVNVTNDIRKYLLSMTYTDNEEEKADDLQLTLEDKDGVWIDYWLNSQNPGEKGMPLVAMIVQKNWSGNGQDKVLECGSFEIDNVQFSSPPAKVTIKATSLPHTSAIRTEKNTKAWENINLSAIANEIAVNGGMACMYESSFNPFFERKEQIQLSDIVFLEGLCKNAGLSLKATSQKLVLFDAAEYESKPSIKTIKRGTADVISCNFSTNFNDTAYSKCHVIYTNPKTGKTIEYTYKPRNGSGDGQTLEINEKVNDREEARQLAIKRLRQKNKSEFQANFTLVGDTLLVAGVTVDVDGYGAFNGKYIIENATHNPTGGYTVDIKLRRVLEGY